MADTEQEQGSGQQEKSGGTRSHFLSTRNVVIGIVAIAFIGWCFAFEPVTRHFVAQDDTCLYCHFKQDYEYSVRMSFSSPHPAEPEAGQEPAACVDCHLPEGFWASAFAYTHFASITDLYGHFRDREGERSGDWIPLSAARAYRVRDRLYEYDSVTCRHCHVMSEIEPKQARGRKAHDDAVKNGDTCIACHTNMVHRFVEVRTASQMQESGEVEAGDEGLGEGLEGPETLDEGLESPDDGGAAEETEGLENLQDL